MTARVSAGAVKTIVPTDLSDSDVTAHFIDTANVYVDTHLVPDAGHSDHMLEKIELYLAAHFVALTTEQGGLTRKKIGDADESYANVFEGGLKSTRFGLQALALDTSGILIAISQTKLKAEFRVV